MTTTPAGYTTVAPWIVTEDTAALLDFVTAAFDGAELVRVPVEDGSIGHAEIRVGDTVLLAFDQGAVSQSGTYLHELMHDGRHLLGVPCH